jgi:O-antigen ligase
MADQAVLALLALTFGVAAIHLAPGLVAGLLWATLPIYGEYLPEGSGLIICTLGMALIAVRCFASRDARWLSRSTPLVLALVAGILVTVRKLFDGGPFAASLAMPLAVAISLLMLFIGLSAAVRVGLLRGIVLGVSVISAAEVLRVAGGGPIHPEAAAFNVNPITIGQFCALGILLSIFLIKQGIARSLHVVTLLICAAGLAVTNSRGPLLALGMALLTMYVQRLLSKEKKRDFRVRPLIPLIVILTAILVIHATLTQLNQWFRVSDEDGNAGGRTAAWSAAARSIGDSPFLGQGPGRYNMGELGATSGLPTFPHNVYLEIWSEYGLIPFTLLAVALIVAVRTSGTAGRPIALGFIICFSISGSLDTSLGLWVALAVALTLTPTSEHLPATAVTGELWNRSRALIGQDSRPAGQECARVTSTLTKGHADART